MAETPQVIVDLVTKFEQNLDEYKHPKYNETLIRVEFVNPFWKALGWDVDNEAGYAMAYRDVIHEDEVKVGSATKAPDYSFRIGGTRKFFLETKKPAVNLKNDPAPAFQLRRYAYSAKLPLSVLTDFEEFIVYDGRQKPSISDKPSTGRIKYYTFRDYPEKWGEIAAVFARESILKGSFDRFAAGTRGKQGTAEIDRDFLADLDRWRIALARNIALRNKQLSARELNHAVQLTIDRLIFLRMCEDRGIDLYGQLLALVNGPQIYPRLVQLYYRADERFNSGLFHFSAEKSASSHPDTLTPSLEIDDKTLKEIIKNLYYPECPYEFSILPVEVLGNAYEQFLGKVIRLTAGHQAKIEEKPEVRKAGGVYYTPKYIVDYIVENTVGQLCRDKTAAEVAELRIVDPACGSGSFLLGAYQYLLDWHLNFYRQEMETSGKIPTVPPPKGQRKRKSDPNAIFQGRGGAWFLTTAEKKRILTNNIYGVDIDANAVEVTKLSLLLKVLENENEDTLSQQLSLWHERALPDLGQNIKCGNSLIGNDFYAGQPLNLFAEEELHRINAFDWEQEFPEIFARGGFDAVVGNPPYVRQETLGEMKAYFQQKYTTYHGMADLYVYFIERGIKLLKKNGNFSYIVANKWMRANYGKPLRQWLKQQQLTEIVDFGDLRVFQGATTYPCILKICEGKPEKAFQAAQVETLDFENLFHYLNSVRFTVNQEKLDDAGWPLVSETTQALLEKLQSKGIPLGEYVSGKIFYGIKTGLNEAFVISKEKRDELIAADPKSAELIKPFLAGREIKRYAPLVPQNFLIFIPKGWTNSNMQNPGNAWLWFKKNYAPVARHLEPFKIKAEKRYDKGEYWWELRACDYYDEFETPKLMLPDISRRGNFSLDNVGGKYCVNTAYILCKADNYLLGILNSKLITFFYAKVSAVFRGGYLRFIFQYLENLPIFHGELQNTKEKSHHDQLVQLVEQMLELHQKLSATQEPHTRNLLQRQISATDHQIDQLVYQLYDLTEEEIKIVEAAVG